MSVQSSQIQSIEVLESTLLDLTIKFQIYPSPEEDLDNSQFCLRLEQAYYLFIDLYPQLVKCFLPNNSDPLEFIHLYWQYSPDIQAIISEDSLHELFVRFQKKQRKMPVFGAIIINQRLDACLCIKGSGNTAGWSFPGGKLSPGEEGHVCAAREVKEETGLDVRNHISETTPRISFSLSGQHITFFVVCGINDGLTLEPETRNEVGEIQWIPLSKLPEDPPRPLYTKFVHRATEAAIRFRREWPTIKQQHINQHPHIPKASRKNKIDLRSPSPSQQRPPQPKKTPRSDQQEKSKLKTAYWGTTPSPHATHDKVADLPQKDSYDGPLSKLFKSIKPPSATNLPSPKSEPMTSRKQHLPTVKPKIFRQPQLQTVEPPCEAPDDSSGALIRKNGENTCINPEYLSSFLQLKLHHYYQMSFSLPVEET